MKGTDTCITAVVYGGKQNEYTFDDIQDMIHRWDDYSCADNLPKWIYESCMHNKNSNLYKEVNKHGSYKKDGIYNFLVYCGSVGHRATVNVASDDYNNNDLEWVDGDPTDGTPPDIEVDELTDELIDNILQSGTDDIDNYLEVNDIGVDTSELISYMKKYRPNAYKKYF